MQIEQKVDEIYLNINSFIKQEKTKSEMIVGDIKIYQNRTFNWLQRKMWKVCFGMEITNLKE